MNSNYSVQIVSYLMGKYKREKGRQEFFNEKNKKSSIIAIAIAFNVIIIAYYNFIGIYR